MRQNTEKRIIGVTKNWEIQGGVLIPFTGVAPTEGLTMVMQRNVPKLAASRVIFPSFHHGDESYWIFDRDEFIRRGFHCLNSPSIVNQAYRRWLGAARKFTSLLKALPPDRAIISPEKINSVYQAYLEQYSYPLITEYFGYASTPIVQKIIKRYGPAVRDDIVTLTQPVRLSFLQEYERKVLGLSLELPARPLTSWTVLSRRHQQLGAVICQIAEEFEWMRSNYRDVFPVTPAVVYREARQLSVQSKQQRLKRLRQLDQYSHQVRQLQTRCRKSTPMSRSEVNKLLAIGFAATWQDQRKAYNLQANVWLNRVLALVSRKNHWPYQDAQYLTPDEFFRVLNGKLFPGEMLIRRRQSGCLYYVFANGDRGMLVGRAAKRVFRAVSRIKGRAGQISLKGLTASPGVVRGKVRLIFSPSRDGQRLRRGDILVAYMTRPDFVPLMRRAAAVVTDEGGLTCHAAIISRELHLPCVVGAKVAMRTLHDGDRIEVDATRGIVRKI